MILNTGFKSLVFKYKKLVKAMKSSVVVFSIILFVSFLAILIIDPDNNFVSFFWGTFGVSAGTIIGYKIKRVINKKINKKYILYVIIIFIITLFASIIICNYLVDNNLYYIILLSTVSIVVSIFLLLKGVNNNDTSQFEHEPD